MKITTKFISSSLIVVGLIVALMSGNILLLRQADRTQETSRKRTDYTLEKLLRLEILLRDQVVALKDFLLLDRNPSDMARYQTAMSNFLIEVESLQYLYPDIPELSVVKSRHERLVKLASALSDEPSSLPQLQQDIRTINSFSKDIELYLSSLLQISEQQNKIVQQQSKQFKETAAFVNYLTIILVILVFLVQFRLFLLPIIRSIQELQFGAATIGSGNLDYRFKINTNDEIELLSKEFNSMAQTLTNFYHDLEEKVKQRTTELTAVNETLTQEIQERQQAEAELAQALQELKSTQSQLIQSEKMSSLGQMVAGVAHEINNPVNFIYGNIIPAQEYGNDLLRLLELYQQYYPHPNAEIQAEVEAIDLDFLIEDFPRLLNSMEVGAKRIRDIVLSLRTFSHLDESEFKDVDIHEGLDSTLMILHNRLKEKPNHPAIEIIKSYGNLPLIECYASELNQVFMNLLANAIDAIEEYNQKRTAADIETNPSRITIETKIIDHDWIAIHILDNGVGMTETVKAKLFDPFFTTKAIGKGTGLGLAIAHSIIVEKHGGKLLCHSVPGEGTEFILQLPRRLPKP